MVAVVQQRRSALNEVLLEIGDLANDPDGAKGSLKKKERRSSVRLDRNDFVYHSVAAAYLLSDVHV